MIVLKVILCCLVFILPLLVGSLYKNRSISLTYLTGQITLWATFQVVAVATINLRTSFTLLFWVFTGIVLLLAGFGLKERIKVRFEKYEWSVFLVFALLIIFFQACKYIFLMHLDEDDARWLAEANDALVTDKMLLFNPATGEYVGRFVGEMVKDVFSPWMIYIAWMSRLTYIRVTVIAHTIYPPMLLIISYLCYWEMGKQLFKGKDERGIFLLMVSIINLFFAGNSFTQSVFTLTRIWQGKAIVAAVVIPAMLTIILRIQNEDKIGDWVQCVLIGIASCLFSGMGIAIGALMIGVYGLYALIYKVIVNRKNSIKRVFLWLLSLLPSVLFGLGYFLQR